MHTTWTRRDLSHHYLCQARPGDVTTRATAWWRPRGAQRRTNRPQFRRQLFWRAGSHPRGAADPARAALRTHREHFRRRRDLKLRGLFHLWRQRSGRSKACRNRSPTKAAWHQSCHRAAGTVSHRVQRSNARKTTSPTTTDRAASSFALSKP